MVENQLSSRWVIPASVVNASFWLASLSAIQSSTR